MRKSALAALVSVAAATGCTSLLGDFTSTDTVTGSDATTEGGVVTSEAGGSNDGTVATSGDAGDAGAGNVDSGEAGATTPGLLVCAEVATQRNNLTANMASSAQLPYGMLSMFNLPGLPGELRIVAAENSTLHAFRIPQGGGAQSDTPLALNPGSTNIFDIERYPGGFAALVQNANSNGPYLAIERFADDAIAWSPEFVVSIANPTNPLPNTEISASLAVVNSAMNEFYIAIYDTENGPDGGTNILRWQHIVPGATPGNLPHVPNLPQGDMPYRLVNPNFSFDMNESYVLMQPGGDMGPAINTSLLYQISPMGFGPGQQAPTQEVLTPPGSDTLFALGMTNSVLTQGSANFMFVEGNLQTGLLSYYVGQVPTSGANNLGSFDYTSLTQSSPGAGDAGYTVDNLTTNHSAVHWESFPSSTPASESLLAVSTIQSIVGNRGMNFVWWDAVTGLQRANKTGAQGLLSGPEVGQIAYANATFASAPTNDMTRILVAYEVLNADASANSNNSPEDIWTTEVDCTLPLHQ